MSLPTDNDARKALPIFTFLTAFFPDAYVEIVKVAQAGNVQHSPGEPLHWARGKSMDQMNTAMRHMFDYGTGQTKDTDGQYHLAKAAWRLMAQLQLDIENAGAVARRAWVVADPQSGDYCLSIGKGTTKVLAKARRYDRKEDADAYAAQADRWHVKQVNA